MQMKYGECICFPVRGETGPASLWHVCIGASDCFTEATAIDFMGGNTFRAVYAMTMTNART